MLKCSLLLFLTLVWLFPLWAAPNNSSPVFEWPSSSTAPEDSQQSKPNLSLEEQNLALTPYVPNKNVDPHSSSLYPYLQTISPRFILALSLELLREGKIPYGMGFSYLIPQKEQPQWEVGTDLLSNSEGQIYVYKRQIFFPDNAFRPYFRVGMGHIWRAEEKLASFGNWKNYALRLGLGFEDLIRLPMSTRLEIEGVVRTEETLILISLGYSWGWE